MLEKSSNPSPSPLQPDQAKTAKLPELKERWAERLRLAEERALGPKLDAMFEFLEKHVGISESGVGELPSSKKKLLNMLDVFGAPLLRYCYLHRLEDPRAELLFARISRELKLLPSASEDRERRQLVTSGFPLGAGPGSLMEFYVNRELLQSGASGLAALLQAAASAPTFDDESLAYLFREVTKRLGDLHSTGRSSLSASMALAFRRGAPTETLADGIFSGLGETLRLSDMMWLYHQAKNPLCGLGVASRVRSELLTALRSATAGYADDEVAKLSRLESFTLPLIVPDLVRRIGRIVHETGSVPGGTVSSLKKILLNVIHDQQEEGLSTKPTEASPENAGPPQSVSGSQERLPLVEDPVKLYLRRLDHESPDQMPELMRILIAAGLDDRESTLSSAFQSHLQKQPIEKLFAVRDALIHSPSAPSFHKQHVDALIHAKAGRIAQKRSLETILNAHLENKRFAGSDAEFPELLDALRSILNLKPPEVPVEPRELTHAARSLWRWIFPKTPPDGQLLEEIVRTHFSKLLASATSRINPDIDNDKNLETVLDYGRELGMLETYRPTAVLSAVPFWKVLHLTAHICDQVGQEHVAVQALQQYLAHRLLTTDLSRWEVGAKPLLRGNFGLSVREICRTICNDIMQQQDPLDLEQHSRLVVNLRLLQRPWLKDFYEMFVDVSRAFIPRIESVQLQDLLSLDTHGLCNVVRALAASRYRSERLLVPLAGEITARAGEIAPENLGPVADALGRLQFKSEPFWGRFAEHVETHWASYEKNTELGYLWALALMQPRLVPARLSAQTLDTYAHAGDWLKVYQTLLALGRMLPTEHSHTFKKLIARYKNEPTQSKSEEHLMRSLPELVNVRPAAVFKNQFIGGCETDLVVDFGSIRLIVELDGDIHFLRGPDGGVRDGRDDFQDKVFKRLWYEVIHIDRSDLEDSVRFEQVAAPSLRMAAARIRALRKPGGPRRLYMDPLGEAATGEAASAPPPYDGGNAFGAGRQLHEPF